MRRELLTGAVILALLPADGVAQEAVLLRYRPAAQAMTRTVSNTEIEARLQFTNLVGVTLPEGEQPDSITFQARVQQALTDRVLQAGDRYLVERTLDSVRIGVTMMGMVASERAVTDPVRAHLLLNDRLEILQFEVQGADTVADTRVRMLRSPIGGFEISLPQDPMGVGDLWSMPMRFPFAVPGDEAAASGIMSLDTVITAAATFALDSLVARGPDSLAYLTMWGRFEPFTVRRQTETGEGTGTVTGDFSGVLIWSTAWNAFGSGAMRTELEMAFTASEGEQRGSGTVAFDIVTRFAIRP